MSVAWQVETVNGKAVVTDIVVEGVSLVVSQRADFASIIRSQGGLDGLIKLAEAESGRLTGTTRRTATILLEIVGA